jgi:hypothetical protein
MSCEAWICCRRLHPGIVRVCPVCGTPRSQLRHSAKAVVYRHPGTNEVRYPPRNDMAMPAVYAREGFVREEIGSMSAFERDTGRVHEASNYSPSSGLLERDTTSHCEPLPIKGLDEPAV